MTKAARWAGLAILLSYAGGCAPESSTDKERSEPKAAARSAPSADREGPFGIALGAPLEAVPGLTRGDEPGTYTTTAPPEPHADFERIVVIGYPGVGICTVRGLGRRIENDAGGSAVRSSIDMLAEALATKYGPPERLDVCSGGDIQCESQFWMMTLLQGQRTYGARWQRQNEAMRRNRIASIYLVATAPDINSGAPVIEYLSSNREACAAAERRQRASAL